MDASKRGVNFEDLPWPQNLLGVDPIGSTNFSKLTNVSFHFMTSEMAAQAAMGSQTNGFNADNFAYGSTIAPLDSFVAMGYGRKQQFTVIIIGLNENVIRISGGALGLSVF